MSSNKTSPAYSAPGYVCSPTLSNPKHTVASALTQQGISWYNATEPSSAETPEGISADKTNAEASFISPQTRKKVLYTGREVSKEEPKIQSTIKAACFNH